MMKDDTKLTEMTCITYGCGNKFLKSEFISISKGSWTKPEGGLWSSPVNSNHGWRDWCESQDWGLDELKNSFVFKFIGAVFVIDSVENATQLPWVGDPKMRGSSSIDWGHKSLHGYDAIHLTEKGERDTRFIMECSLYGWDVETLLVLNPKSVFSVN